MRPPKLILPPCGGTAFTRGFHNALANGMPRFEVGKVRGLPKEKDGQQFRWRQCMVVEYGGKRVLIHAWDYTSELAKLTADDVDLILCVQYSDDLPEKCSVPVYPFTMFASDQINFYEKLPALRNIVGRIKGKHNIGFSGRVWESRKPYWMLSNQDWFYFENTGKQATGNGTLEEYMAKLGTWLRCLILYGKGSRLNASHNRRENECAALSVPMVLNYEPQYYEPFRAGEHFTLIECPVDLLQFEQRHTLSREECEMAANALRYWERNMSIEGVSRLFMQICDERL